MSDKCAKCAEVIAKGKDSITCVECKLTYHPLCTRISTVDNFRKMGAKKSVWKCDDCKTDTSSIATQSEAGEGSAVVLKAIQKMSEDMGEKFKEAFDHLKNLSEDVKAVKLDISALKSDLSDLKDEQNKLTQELVSVKAENSAMQSELKNLRESVQHLEQYSRVNNLMINGIPVTPKENVYSVLASVADVLGVEFHGYDITIAHRLNTRSGDTRPPPIVAQFSSRKIKNEWLTARRVKKTLKTTELPGRLPESDIYVNEHLTPITRGIFNHARQLVKDGTLHQVWTADCKVFVRKEQNGKALKITHINQLKKED